MKNCQNCGSSERATAYIVEECGVCGQEQHDYETLDSLKRKLAAYEAAYRRLNALLQPEPEGKAMLGFEGWQVYSVAVKEAMLLEHELFPIGGETDAVL